MPIQECESLGRWGWRIYLHCPHLPLLPAGGSIGHHFLEIERDYFSKIYFLLTSCFKAGENHLQKNSNDTLYFDSFSKYNNFHWECVDFGQKPNCFWQWRVVEIPKPNYLIYLPVLLASLFWYEIMSSRLGKYLIRWM